MRRVWILLIIAVMAAAPAQARNLGTLVFQPTAAQTYEAASGQGAPVINPLPASNTIRLNVPPFVYAVSAYVVGLPSGGVELIAFCTPQGGASLQVVLTSRPTRFCADGWHHANTVVSFQVKLTGPVPAGTYTMTVTYDYGSGSSHGGRWGGSDTSTVILIVPSVLAIQLTGGDTVAFDYTSDPTAYVNAWGGTLPPTSIGTTFQALDVYGDGGYTVTASITPAATNPPGQLPVSKLEILGKRLSAQPITIAQSANPAPAPKTIVTAGDYALAVDGSEPAGTYDYTVDYSVVLP